MSFSEYWKAEAAKRRKTSRDKRFADNHSQMEEIRKEVYTKLNPYDYHQYIENITQNRIPLQCGNRCNFIFRRVATLVLRPIYFFWRQAAYFLAFHCL